MMSRIIAALPPHATEDFEGTKRSAKIERNREKERRRDEELLKKEHEIEREVYEWFRINTNIHSSVLTEDKVRHWQETMEEYIEESVFLYACINRGIIAGGKTHRRMRHKIMPYINGQRIRYFDKLRALRPELFVP